MAAPERKKPFLIFLFLAVLLFAAYLIWDNSRETSGLQPPDYWPTSGWQQSTPEEAGMDSVKLAEGLLAVRAEKIDIHSLMIIRQGRVVVDAVFYPYDGKTLHEMASVTKSIITTLIAIAADQGKLDLDQTMVSFFPDRTIANRDERKEQITVRHLASMTSGLESMGYAQDEGTLKAMRASGDWIQFALDRPVVSEPGTQFVYDSPGMHLLSAILQQATGMTAQEFARQNLFAPLGISDVIWPLDPQGYNHGWGDLFLHREDAAKIGFLWLNHGLWDGQQIVPAQWVEESVQVQAQTGDDDDYGYGWWVMHGDSGPEYAAIGRGGQRIHVLPALQVVIVTTGGGFDIDEIWPYLIPALVDPEKPLATNPAGETTLDQALAAILVPPEPDVVAPLPETAGEISGQTYVLMDNPMQIKSLRLDFNGGDEAEIRIIHPENPQGLMQKVGLDGVYRMTAGEHDLSQGLRGYWADDQTFVLEYDEIAANDHGTFRLTFQDDRVQMTGQETAHETVLTIEGKLQESQDAP